MTPSGEHPDQDGSDQLDEIIAEYVSAVQRGDSVDREAWLERHPSLEEKLPAFFEDYARLGRISEPLPSDVSDPYGLVGARFGDYEVLEHVARGGMGAVFRARQVSVGRIVALKLVLGGRLASAEERLRFLGE